MKITLESNEIEKILINYIDENCGGVLASEEEPVKFLIDKDTETLLKAEIPINL